MAKPSSAEADKQARLLAALIDRVVRDERFALERIAASSRYFGGRRDARTYRERAWGQGADDRFASYFALAHPVRHDGIARRPIDLVLESLGEEARAAIPIDDLSLRRARFVAAPMIMGRKIGTLDVAGGGEKLPVRAAELVKHGRGLAIIGWLIPTGTHWTPAPGALLIPLVAVPRSLAVPDMAADPLSVEGALSVPRVRETADEALADMGQITFGQAVSLFEQEARDAGFRAPARSLADWQRLTETYRANDDIPGFLDEALRGPHGERRGSLPMVRFQDLAYAALRIWEQA